VVNGSVTRADALDEGWSDREDGRGREEGESTGAAVCLQRQRPHLLHSFSLPTNSSSPRASAAALLPLQPRRRLSSSTPPTGSAKVHPRTLTPGASVYHSGNEDIGGSAPIKLNLKPLARSDHSIFTVCVKCGFGFFRTTWRQTFGKSSDRRSICP
jgi:hypothetical protein